MNAPLEARMRERVRRKFNRISAPYADFALVKLRRETARELELIRPRPEDRVLDVACGPGTLALALAPHVREVCGLDIAQRMVGRARLSARDRFPAKVHFIVADAERIPFPDDWFDLVTCGYSFANFVEPARILAEMARVTRQTGRLVIVELLAPTDPAKREALLKLEELRGGFRTPIFSFTDFQRLFQSSGLRLVDCRIRKRPRWFRDWARLGSLAPRSHAYRRAWQMLLSSLTDDALGLEARRVGNDIRFYHTTATFLLEKAA